MGAGRVFGGHGGSWQPCMDPHVTYLHGNDLLKVVKAAPEEQKTETSLPSYIIQVSYNFPLCIILLDTAHD